MRGTLKTYGINKVFILGAGFSAPLGMPLTGDLLRLSYEVATQKPWYDEGKPVPYGMGQWMLDELQWYFPLEKFTHEKLQEGDIPNNFDFEKFLSYAYAISAFGEQWDAHGDKFVSFLRIFLGQAIFNKQIECFNRKIDQPYKSFVKSLSNSLVMTFNWDTVLEYFMEQSRIDYSYDFPSTYNTSIVPIIKLHGSIDWFSDFEYKEKDWMKFSPVYRPSNGIKDGEIIYDDPVLFRSEGNLLDYYDKAYMSPRIIAPGYDKLSQVVTLGDYWKYPWMFLQDELEVIIIGFSLRPDDYHSRAFLYPQLFSGAKEGNLSIKVIDYAISDEDRAEIEARYEGIENISFWFDGFNEDAVRFITD